MAYRNNADTMSVTRSFAMSQDRAAGAMICIRGDAIGSMVPLQSDRKVVVGRDPSVCNLVISNPKVSRKHLEITDIGTLDKYRGVDCSSNGTFLQKRYRLNRDQDYYLESMTELHLGSDEVIYKLR